MAKNLIQLLTPRSKTGATGNGATSPASFTETPPLVLDEEPVEAVVAEESSDLPSSPLQSLASAIQKASVDLHQLDDIRMKLEALKAPLSVEFENRVADNNRLAQLTSELRTARARLTEVEAAYQRSGERARDLDMQVVTLSGELDRNRVSLAAASESLERLRPGYQEALAQLDEMRSQAVAAAGEIFDLKTDKEYLTRQLEMSETGRSSAESLLARTRESQAEMEARAEGALKRLEQAVSENISLERTLAEMKVSSAGEHDRSAELTAQLAAARAEARLAQETMKEQGEINRQEIKDLRAKLEDAASRSKRMQQLQNEMSANQTTMLDEKSKQQRDLSAAQSENRQAAQRIEVLEGWLADWRRRFGDVDAARLVAVDRAEELQVSLSQSEATGKRVEALAEAKSNALEEASRVNESEQNRLRSEIAELKSSLSQSRAELKMMRASLAAKS